MQASFINQDTPNAARQPKTDRLILARYLGEKAKDAQFTKPEVHEAQNILVRWADLESKGRLGGLSETQLQGDFLAEVFGQALGYTRAVENAESWHLEQHHSFSGQTPDAVLGRFSQNNEPEPMVVVELKGASVHLDRDRSGGRTAVDQCWDYLVNTPPTCRWGIVSNLVSFRLYERNSTKRAYEHFSLQSLRDFNVFRQFYVLFHRKGLIEEAFGATPRAVVLLEQSAGRQRDVSEELYEAYSDNRIRLISELHHTRGLPLESAIDMAQRLLDRIVFIAFCEDRGLLPEGTIDQASKTTGFHAVTNPRWQNFKNLFRFIDVGNPTYNIPPYNGGLFAPHPVDDLELPDEWTQFFMTLGGFDFADEVNLDVLGHLFERSITEIEKLKESGFFGGDAEKAGEFARMPQSAKRKQLGVYYTPPELTSLIVQYAVGDLIDERFAELAVQSRAPEDRSYWRGCFDVLRNLKIVDPACGSGAFLFQAYNLMEQRYHEVIGHLDKCGDPEAAELSVRVPHLILGENLYGVDLSPEAVEISQLALWIRSAARDQTLAVLSHNLVHGNSVVSDPAVSPSAFDWRERFPEVFERPGNGFDCVIGNPPWEKVKLQEREFFSLTAPEIATATNAAKRRMLVAKLETKNPILYARYLEAQKSAEEVLTHLRTSGSFPLTGRGDINLYAIFSELGSHLVSPKGRVGLLTQSGIASDKTTKDFFASIAESGRLIRLYDFENKRVFFPEVHASLKFCILIFGGSEIEHDPADFAFFLHKVEELNDPKKHIPLSGKDIRLLNPNTRTCPIFRTRRDAEITKSIYRRVPVLIDRNREGPTGNPWGITFKTMFHQTNDAELFHEADQLKGEGCKLKGNVWNKGKKEYLPVYEAKMVQMYDHRAANVVTADGNWVRQGQTEGISLVEHQNPERTAMPRYWISEENLKASSCEGHAHFLSFKDVTSPTNQRTMIAAMIPFTGVVNSAPLVLTSQSSLRDCCLLGNLNSLVYDFVMRQKIGNVHLNFFIVEQIPTFSPDTYDKPCPWAPKTKLEKWISERVLKLTCTAVDMLPLAEACNFTGGSFKAEYGGRLNKWDETERANLMADLDAAFFHLYGIDRSDAEYILSTFKGIHERGSHPVGGLSTGEAILQKYDELLG